MREKKHYYHVSKKFNFLNQIFFEKIRFRFDKLNKFVNYKNL
jgi:hypothetical protein